MTGTLPYHSPSLHPQPLLTPTRICISPWHCRVPLEAGACRPPPWSSWLAWPPSFNSPCSMAAHSVPAEHSPKVPHKVKPPSKAEHDLALPSQPLAQCYGLPISSSKLNCLQPLPFPPSRMLFPLPIQPTPLLLSGISLSIWPASCRPSWPPSFSFFFFLSF